MTTSTTGAAPVTEPVLAAPVTQWTPPPQGGVPPRESPVLRFRRQLGLRLIPGLLFFVLSVPQLGALSKGVTRGLDRGTLVGDFPGLVAAALYLGFIWLNVVFFVSRPPASKRDGRLGAWALAMLGTFGLVVAPLLPGGPRLFDLGTAGVDARLVLSIISMSLAIITLCILGRSFGLTPEARRLVSAGPYRLVRHPLYMCEAVSIVGLALVSGDVAVVAAATVVLGAQVGRARLEERVLTAAFPEYPEVMHGVPHFLPGIY